MNVSEFFVLLIHTYFNLYHRTRHANMNYIHVYVSFKHVNLSWLGAQQFPEMWLIEMNGVASLCDRRVTCAEMSSAPPQTGAE